MSVLGEVFGGGRGGTVPGAVVGDNVAGAVVGGGNVVGAVVGAVNVLVLSLVVAVTLSLVVVM